MLHNNTALSSDEYLRLIEERLLNDKEFRKAFFRDPVSSIGNICAEPTPAIIKILTDFEMPRIKKEVENFNEKLVLCSSSGN